MQGDELSVEVWVLFGLTMQKLYAEYGLYLMATQFLKVLISNINAQKQCKTFDFHSVVYGRIF